LSKEAAQYTFSKTLKNSINIRVITAPYFLATKLEAFKDRGENNFIWNHDIEDIIAILDGREEIIDDFNHCSSQLKKYLSSKFSSLMQDDKFKNSLPGHLNYSNESTGRTKIVEERIKEIINLGQE